MPGHKFGDRLSARKYFSRIGLLGERQICVVSPEWARFSGLGERRSLKVSAFGAAGPVPRCMCM